jgi:hypothetical protein
VDRNGNISVDGDSNIYDDVNLPKIHVQAWTDALFQQHKKEQAAAAAAKKKAAEPQLVLEERTPTPEPAPKMKKIRLIMKAKGKEDFRLSVNPVGGTVSNVAIGLIFASLGLRTWILLMCCSSEHWSRALVGFFLSLVLYFKAVQRGVGAMMLA